MVKDWYARPVLFVADIDRTLDFYVNRLGFTESWRHAEEGKTIVAQVNRQTSALIFSSQWPDKVGKGLTFISLNVDAPPEQFSAEEEKAVDALRAEFEGRGATVEDGQWGYKVLVVRDPDGNELYFNYPASTPV